MDRILLVIPVHWSFDRSGGDADLNDDFRAGGTVSPSNSAPVWQKICETSMCSSVSLHFVP